MLSEKFTNDEQLIQASENTIFFQLMHKIAGIMNLIEFNFGVIFDESVQNFDFGIRKELKGNDRIKTLVLQIVEYNVIQNSENVEPNSMGDSFS